MSKREKRKRMRAAMAALAIVAALGAGAPASATAGPASDRPASAAARAKADRGKRHDARWARRERARLRKLLRRNPLGALKKPSFLRTAALVNFKLPATVRLNTPPAAQQPGGQLPDDQLTIAWNTDTVPWPAVGVPFPNTPPTTVTIDGGWTMEIDFGAETSGYGVGALEASQGLLTRLTGTAFPIAAFAGGSCAPDPTPTTPLLAAAERPDGTAGVTIDSSEPRYAVLNPFFGTMTGTMSLYFRFRSAPATCALTAPPANTRIVDPTGATPVPITWNGSFRISPAITPDGQIRLGRIVAEDVPAGTQPSSFGKIWACTVPSVGVDPCKPTPNTADPEYASGAATALGFPARVTVTRLTADVLIGQVL